MSIPFDPYEMLGVAASTPDDEIKQAYRRLARRLHPDINKNAGAAKHMQEISAAYDALSDSGRRRQVDDQRRARVDEPYFTLRATASRRKLNLLREPQVVYVLAEMFPDPRAEEGKTRRETHLNLALVLDHSNSMNGVRLEKVKVAAHQIIESLTEKDIISVIGFNDRGTVIIPATHVRDKPALKARISMMAASGGTEIYQGLSAGLEQVQQYLGPNLVNHILLLTDGRTYGDEPQCLDLASAASKEGISISAMGLGSDWNDHFLDQIASKTGGTSEYINSAGAVVRFLNDHVKRLSSAFADRIKLIVAPDSDVEIESAFKLAPNAQSVEVRDGEVLLGSMQPNHPVSVLLQLVIGADIQPGFRSLLRLSASGDILDVKSIPYTAVSDLSIDVTEEDSYDDPPTVIMDALSKLTLYRLQERANEAVMQGNPIEATRKLEHLATHLLAMGEQSLAQEAMNEARRIASTQGFSDEGRKSLKYSTRLLITDKSSAP